MPKKIFPNRKVLGFSQKYKYLSRDSLPYHYFMKFPQTFGGVVALYIMHGQVADKGFTSSWHGTDVLLNTPLYKAGLYSKLSHSIHLRSS